MTRPETLTSAGVAEALGVHETHFRAVRRKLEDAGFPPKLPGLAGRWSRFCVLRWIRTNGETFRPSERPEAESAGAAGPVRVEALRRALEGEYGR